MTTCQGRDCHNLLRPQPVGIRPLKWCSDRCRKTKYSVPCEDCGKPLSGSDGRGPNAPRHCPPCANVRIGAEVKVWTPGAVVAAMREWAREFGEPPSLMDWNPSEARNRLHDPARAERFEALHGRYPSVTSVVHEFGTWNAGMVAAGFEPRAPHGGGGNGNRQRSMRAKVTA